MCPADAQLVRSGVPRQSLYKEVGTKSELGEAVVAREVDRFLGGVLDSVDRRPDSVAGGLAAAPAGRHRLRVTTLVSLDQPSG